MRRATLSVSNPFLKTVGLVIIVVIIGFTGYYVVHSKHKADPTLSSTTASSTSAAKLKPAKQAATTTPAIAAGQVKFSTLPTDLQAALMAFDQQKEPACVSGSVPVKQGVADDPLVRYIAGYAEASIPTCDDGSATLFVKTNNQWQEVAQTQLAFKCQLLQQYKVPASIVINGDSTICIDATNKQVPYSQA